MKNIFKLTVLFSVTLFVGCQEEFLETFPTEQISSEQISEASRLNPGLQSASVAGIYATMYTAYAGGTGNHEDFGQKSTDIKTDLLSGDMALARKGYNRWASISELTAPVDFTHRHNYQEWRYFYKIIFAANTVIDALSPDGQEPEGAEARAFMGQALAARAYGYLYLSQLFVNDPSPANANQLVLPIYTDTQTPNVAKSSLGDVYDLMISDLTRAVNYLGGWTRGDKSQIDQWVARGLLAYAYGAKGDFAQMGTVAAEVVNSGVFTIMPNSQIVFQGDNNQGGFNNINAASGAMWGVDLTADQGIGLVSFWGQMDIFSYSYQWAGNIKAMDESLYSQISDDDVRKGQFGPYGGVNTVPYNKFYHEGRTTGGQRQVTADLFYMRVAEMYLLAAEGAAEANNLADARTYLKALVGQRLTTGDTSYIDGLDKSGLLAEITFQSRVELWGEGKSYFRVKRRKETVNRGSNWLDFPGTSYPYNDEQLTFEIPEEEIRDNPLISEQN